MHDGEEVRVATTRERISRELLEKVDAARKVYDTDRTSSANVDIYRLALRNFNEFINPGQANAE